MARSHTDVCTFIINKFFAGALCLRSHKMKKRLGEGCERLSDSAVLKASFELLMQFNKKVISFLSFEEDMEVVSETL
jgi:hypothetical protein